MPVVEFALDSSAEHRIQVHLPTKQPAPVTVMLNRSILGSMSSEEQPAGKDFRLPDNSFLQVRIMNGQPQVSRAGYPLASVDATMASKADLSPAAQALERDKKLGGCLITWLILNLVVIGYLTLLNILTIFGAIAKGISPGVSVLFSLLGVVGIVGLSFIFLWKKLGFYLAVAYVVLGFLLSIPFGLLDVRSFVPLVSIVILYVYLNRSGVWDKMR